jgi:hypothetical protein
MHEPRSYTPFVEATGHATLLVAHRFSDDIGVFCISPEKVYSTMEG